MYKVGEFVFDYQRAELGHQGQVKKLEPQINELLKLFVENPGQLVTKEQIIHLLWPNRIITDDAFRAVIKKLRRALGDSAKEARYVRTLPLKGYILIAEVSVLPSKATPSIHLRYRLLSIVALISLVLFYLFSGETVIEPKLEALTKVAGSEVSPSFNSKLNHLLYSHRAEKDDYLQLYTKSLESGEITQLTFGEANFANAYFSYDGSKIAFTRSTVTTSDIVIADYSPQTGLTNYDTLPQAVSSQRYLQSWRANGQGLYLSDAKKPLTPQGIWYYRIDNQTLQNITSPGGNGGGDYFARESHNGRWLAVLRNSDSQSHELLIQHLASGELSHIALLPKAFNRLVWQRDDESILLSSFHSDFAQYDLSVYELHTIELDIPYLNDVFYGCGKHCFYARQHNGNYLDLQYLANPFSENSVSHFGFHTQLGAQDFPIMDKVSYKTYFVTKQYGRTELIAADRQMSRVLHTFPRDSDFSALQLDTEGRKLAGIVDGRLFVFDLEKNAIEFLTTSLEQVSTPVWASNLDHLHYARLEHGSPVIYRYELDTQTTIREEVDHFAKIKVSSSETLLLDDALQVWYQKDGKKRFLTTLQSASSNRWLMRGEWLYYTTRKENLAYLERVNVYTGAIETQFLAKNRYRLNFDLSADAEVMLAVRSLLAQSDLVKIKY